MQIKISWCDKNIILIIIGYSAFGCTYLSALMHMRIWACISTWVSMIIGTAYMYVYAYGRECICMDVLTYIFLSFFVF